MGQGVRPVIERRPWRYDGVLVSRDDQSTGTGTPARFGPALFDQRSPDFASDVNWGRDDYSVMQDSEARDIGSGARLQVSRNDDGSYEVKVSGGGLRSFSSNAPAYGSRSGNTIWIAPWVMGDRGSCLGQL